MTHAGVTVRAFRPDDAPALAALFHAAVRETGRRDYSAAQVLAWSPASPPPDAYLKRAEARSLFVAVDEADAPLGYGDVDGGGQIDHLYVRPDATDRGVGSALLAVLETTAREAGLRALRVEASEGARRLLLRRGFEELVRQDFVLRGTEIHNYRMLKALAPGDPDDIFNWRRIDDRLTTSGQPDEAQLAVIRDLGVTRVVNLALHTHPRALADERATVEGLGLRYIHIPVPFDAPTEADYARFREVMAEAAAERVHVHCIANLRVSAFLLRLRRETGRVDAVQAQTELESVWRPGGCWARFIGDFEREAEPHLYAGRDY